MKIIRDGKGRIIGHTVESGDKVYVRDQNGHNVGFYSKTADRTFDEKGVLFGYGDHTQRLLKGS